MVPGSELSEVYSAAEIARAAGVPRRTVDDLLRSGAVETIDGRFVAGVEARRVGVALRLGLPLGALASHHLASTGRGDRLFAHRPDAGRSATMPAAVSTAVHLLAVATIAWIATWNLGASAASTSEPIVDETRLVFLNLPGPGGGGGGGGLGALRPPPKAKLEGREHLDSPVPKPPPPPDPPKVVEPPPPELEVKPLPPIIAPVASKASDAEDKPGLPKETPVVAESRGPGDQGGTGEGRGTGLGEGQGPGIGDGSGGGTGGGPFRPGAGIDPPSLVREVKPDYTEDARRRGVAGDVVLEIVVRRDGTVGDVKVLEGLGYGLEKMAMDAVRQWRFRPARRFGTPVDVVVEVAVEFKLR
ncbi:MAG: energy transducer TonB [Vicinamibacterales bacterium]